ncbi:hypothetical protein BDZ89DRAFT_1048365 [Hymenopellis radicata]|nr:hypothetical protein BDZ89DRAFT_1048365 [Hymenopellis radicata]
MSFHQFQTEPGNQGIRQDDDIPSAADHGAAVGSLEHDRRNGYTLSWESMAAFHVWKAEEEETNIVEWPLKDSPKRVGSAALCWSSTKHFSTNTSRSSPAPVSTSLPSFTPQHYYYPSTVTYPSHLPPAAAPGPYYSYPYYFAPPKPP